jgi:hypothetical protein
MFLKVENQGSLVEYCDWYGIGLLCHLQIFFIVGSVPEPWNFGIRMRIPTKIFSDI